jgi:hypothetical protein
MKTKSKVAGILALIFSFVALASGGNGHSNAHETAIANGAKGPSIIVDGLQNIAGVQQQDWWADARKNIREQEYHVTYQCVTSDPESRSCFQAPNRGHNLRIYFRNDGIKVTRRTESNSSWQVNLFLESIGRGEELVLLPKSETPVTNGSRVKFERDIVVEWYDNKPEGLEQGFTVTQKLKGSGDLTLLINLSGSLRPRMSSSGREIHFCNSTKETVLKYSKLFVEDLTGQQLESYLALKNNAIQIVVDDSQAVYPIYIDPLLETPGWEKVGDQTGAQLGASVSTAGDVNGDGYSDVIVGASGIGRSYVFYGSATGLGSVADWATDDGGLSVGTAGDVNGDGFWDVVVGDGSSSRIYHGSSNGLSLVANQVISGGDRVNAAGDVNGDGYGDVIVGDGGTAFVYHGSASGLTAVASFEVSTGDRVASAGDVNGDGFSDIIVGSYGANRSYVYEGSVTGLGTTASWNTTLGGHSVAPAGDVNGDGYADVIIGSGSNTYVFHGSGSGLSAAANWNVSTDGDSVYTAGDVNGDGYSDVIVGEEDYNNNWDNKGRAYVYLGSAGGLSTTAAWSGAAENGHATCPEAEPCFGPFYGHAVSTAGDINGDGYCDILVGANLYNISGNFQHQGKAFLYHGSASGLSATEDWEASLAGDFVAIAGDVNGDGFSDVIVSDPGFDNGQDNEGKAFVFYGSASGPSATPDWAVESNQSHANLGSSISSAGDVNGDGYSDIIVGASGYDNGESNEGCAFVYYGSSSGLDQNSTRPDGTPSNADWTVESNQSSANLGYAVATAGDVNGDGFSDIIIGVSYYDDSEIWEGKVFVYYGSASGLGPNGNPENADWTAESNQADSEFGVSVSTAGDVNSDSYSDIVVGASGYDNGESNEGCAFVYYGSSSGLDLNGTRPDGTPSNADWTAESNLSYTYFAGSVGSAGDIDGDGYDDVIVGAASYSNGQSYEGAAFVYHGSATGLNQGGARPSGSLANADWAYESNLTETYFGCSVDNAGDVNGDGYSDVIVGAHALDPIEIYYGRVYAFYGSSSGLSPTYDWVVVADWVNSGLGKSVSSAGDVNGDGYSDIIVGAPSETRALVYYGNEGSGLPISARQLKIAGTPIAHLGMSDSEVSYAIAAVGYSPMGRSGIQLEWEVAPINEPFDGSPTGTSAWFDSGTTGYDFIQQVTDLWGHTPYHWRARFRYPIGNIMGIVAGRWFSPFPGMSTHLRTNNNPPIGGFTQNSDNVIPASQVSQSTEESNSGTITVHFRIKDLGSNFCTLHSFWYSVDGGSTWKVPSNGDSSASLGGGWPDNGGTDYSSGTDWSGTIHSFTFDTKHADVSADFNGVDQSDVQIRFRVNDGLEDSAAYATSENFQVDHVPPTTGTIAINDNNGNTNDATPDLTLSSTDADYMRFALSEGDLSSATEWVDYATSYSAFNISSGGNGTKTIWVEFRDEFWNIQETHASDSTNYDTSPVYMGEDITDDNPPTWTWESSGDGTGLFRYKLNDDDLEHGATETTDTWYTHPSALSPEGTNTLYVQEENEAGYWGNTGSFTIEVDSGDPCSEASSPAVVDDLSQTFTITYIHDDIYAGETCGTANSGSGLVMVDLYVKGPNDEDFPPDPYATDSDGDIDGQFSYTASDEGGYDFYTIATDKAGNVELTSGSDTQTIYASQFSGYAIVAVGAYGDEEEGIESHTLTANNVYKHLINRNFALVDNPVDRWSDPLDHIKYFNPYSEDQVGEDDYTEGGSIIYWEAMQKAITQWALSKMTNLSGPLFITLIDHGIENVFYLEGFSVITSQDLDDWLTILETGLASEGIEEDIVIILGSCYSGSFMDELSKSGRIIVAASAADEPSYRGPEEPVFGIRDGEFFTTSLFNELAKGKNLRSSFKLATDRIEIHTDSGYGNSGHPYFDNARQHPFLDDDGVLPGSHELTPGGDGDRSENIYLGYATDAVEPVEITEVIGYPDTVIGTSSLLVWAKVSNTDTVDRVWVEVREPNTTLEGGSEQQLVDLIEVSLNLNGDRYEATLPIFSESGRYTLFFYARDDAGFISPFKKSYVYRELSNNSAPDPFSLASPANTTEVPISLVLDWEDTQDTTDGHDITYLVTISTNPDLSNAADWIYREEGIEYSTLRIDASNGIENQTTYYWQVIAIDEYGATAEASVWSFTTDNVTNPATGWIKGHVYDSISGQPITNAVVTIGGIGLNTALGGYYLHDVPPGQNYTVTAQAPGYSLASYPGVIINEGNDTTVDFGLVPSGDSDGDGILDSQDNCPSTPNPNQEDADEDGVGDVCDPFPDDPNEWLDTDGDLIGNNADPDDDNDGMPDTWEIQYGLDPLVDDASGDLDGDGVSNLDEYNAGTDPTNAAPDTPALSSPDNGQINESLTPELQTGDFSDPDGDTHAETTWQISTESNFSSLVLDITSDSLLTSLTVPEFIVTVNTTYYWRAKFFDDLGAASEWSDPYWFTTIDASASDDTDSNGIPDDQENVEVDMDDNGASDILEDDIKSVNTVVGDGQIGIKKESTNITSIDSIKSIDPDTISDTTNKPDEMPLGLITFKITVDNPGDDVEVVVYLSEPAPIGAKWYKYDIIHGWREYPYATFSADRTYVTLALKDGDWEYGDCDGTENRIIVDPSGLGTAPTPPPPSGDAGGGGGGGCFIATAAYGSPMESHVKTLREFRDRFMITNCVGKAFIDLYNTLSPPVADFIANYDTLRFMVRYSLLPIVGVSWMSINIGLTTTLALTLLLLIMIVGATTAVVFRRMR